jgi:ketosteroid isomerase-like protein
MNIDLINKIRKVAAELTELAGEAERAPAPSSDDAVALAERTVTRFLDLLERGELNDIDELVHPAAPYVIPGRSRISGLYEGPDGVRAASSIIPRAGVTELSSKIVDLVASADQVATFHELRGVVDGRSVQFDIALRFTVREGMIHAITEYSGDQYTSDDLFTARS